MALAKNKTELVRCVCGDSHVPGDYVDGYGQRRVCEMCTGQPMIMCDVCNSWYHLSCLRLSAEDIPLGEFWCFRCTANGKNRTSQMEENASLKETDMHVPRVSLRNLDERARIFRREIFNETFGGIQLLGDCSSAWVALSRRMDAQAQHHPRGVPLAMTLFVDGRDTLLDDGPLVDASGKPLVPVEDPLPSPAQDLNSDALSLVLSFLPLDELARCSAVCRAWRDTIDETPSLWRSIGLSENYRSVTDSALAGLHGRLRHTQRLDLSLCAHASKAGLTAALAAVGAQRSGAPAASSSSAAAPLTAFSGASGASGGGGGLRQLSLAFCVQARDDLFNSLAMPGAGAHVGAAPGSPSRLGPQEILSDPPQVADSDNAPAAGAGTNEGAAALPSGSDARRSGRKRRAVPRFDEFAEDDENYAPQPSRRRLHEVGRTSRPRSRSPTAIHTFSFASLTCLDLSGTDVGLFTPSSTPEALRRISAGAPRLAHLSLLHSTADSDWDAVRAFICAVTASQARAAGLGDSCAGLQPASARLLGLGAPGAASAAGASGAAGGAPSSAGVSDLSPPLMLFPALRLLLVSLPEHKAYVSGPDEQLARHSGVVVFPGAVNAAPTHNRSFVSSPHELRAMRLAQALQRGTDAEDRIKLAAIEATERPFGSLIYGPRTSAFHFANASRVSRAQLDRVLAGFTETCRCSLRSCCGFPPSERAARPGSGSGSG